MASNVWSTTPRAVSASVRLLVLSEHLIFRSASQKPTLKYPVRRSFSIHAMVMLLSLNVSGKKPVSHRRKSNANPTAPQRPGAIGEIKKDSRSFVASPCLSIECERRDLNPHPFRNWILSPARLPFRHSGEDLEIDLIGRSPTLRGYSRCIHENVESLTHRSFSTKGAVARKLCTPPAA